MKYLFASDSFKGSLSSRRTAELLTQAAGAVFGDVECDSVTVADGGEGTAEALVQALAGEMVEARVHGPLMETVTARYGWVRGDTAVIEMAAASGLPLVPVQRRNPLYTTSYGTGELIRHALDRGAARLLIAIGGSATNDGGMGCASALGVRFLDETGRSLAGRGEDLERVRDMDLSGLDPRLAGVQITVLCDVDNPLCGPRGATWTYGAQKGATESIQRRLEAGMECYRDVIRAKCGADPDAIPGGGAAGGLGTALAVFLRAELRPGITTVLETIGFRRRLEGVDLVVTGEGRTDNQSVCGKVMQGVGELAREMGVPVVGLCGSLGPGAELIYDHGVGSLMTTVDAPMPLEEALERAEALYFKGAERMFRMLKTGMALEAHRRGRE